MNKKLISGRKDLTQGWEFWKGKKKKKKKKLLQHGVFEFGHPAK